MNRRDIVLKAIRFERPDYIPMVFHVNPACWNHYDRHALQDAIDSHPLLFQDLNLTGEGNPYYSPNAVKDKPYRDSWGCIWETAEDGITGTVTKHPLESWDDFTHFTPPSPDVSDGTFPIDWKRIEASVQDAKKKNRLVKGTLPHGHTFLRLQDIRGYANLTYDMADENPNLFRLVDMVSDFNYGFMQHWLALEPDIFCCPEDLGMQVGPMISPDHFKKYIKPVFKRMMQPAREKGIIVHMHSDGDIRSLVDDLTDGGVQVINLQDLVNGIDWIADKFAHKTCIDLDIDRQYITAQGTPQEIDALIKEEVEKLGSKEGGLMMIYGLYPHIPWKNVTALLDAMQNYATYYS